MKRSFENSFSLGILLFFVFAQLARAEGEKWVFIPFTPLFHPLIADPREPQTGVVAYTSQNRYEGAVGTTVELLRYLPSEGEKWGWGIFGAGYILLDEYGATFPMRDGDWYAGMYVSETSGMFSHCLEFVHQSSHLGDSRQGLQTPVFYSRENLNYTFSFDPDDSIRLYAGMGAWENMAPADNAFFASLGTELYSPVLPAMGTELRGYTTLHFQWKAEAGGVLNKTWQVGIQWKFKKEESRAIRLALVYYNGNSEFGQFYMDHDEHWGIGVYFDP